MNIQQLKTLAVLCIVFGLAAARAAEHKPTDRPAIDHKPKPEPPSLTFNTQLIVTNSDLSGFEFAVVGQTPTRNQSSVVGGMCVNIQYNHNIIGGTLTVTDADGDEIAMWFSGTQHPMAYEELVTLGYYDTKAGGVYSVLRATGKYSTLADEGAFTAATRFYPQWPYAPMRGEGTLTFDIPRPKKPLPAPGHRK